MTPEVSLEIQWFAFALVNNEVISDEEAQSLWEQLDRPADLSVYAEAVVNELCEGKSLEEQNEVVEQIQQLCDFACERAGDGQAPDWSSDDSSGGTEAAEPAQTGDETAGTDAAPAPAVGGISENTAVHFDALDLDLAGIQGYEDLPSLSDTPQLSDEELQERVILMLTCLRYLGCSDLHLSAGAPPFVRRLRQIERIDSYVLTEDDAQRLNFALLSEDRRRYFLEKQDLSMALEVGSDRFRVCLMQQKQGVSGAYRLVPDHICSLEELGFLDKDIVYIKRLLDYNNGLVLVTGPIGAGKTTTLAAMINIVNQKRADHIISVEDPIEILQMSQGCQVSQREVGRHTMSYRNALKAALREDPDVIVIGEMHDLETIENAITAAETGHLVIGTLHTGNAPNTLNRLLDVFPPAQQPQIRAMTAGSMRGVVCQKLVPDGFGGLTLIYEIMLNTMAVANIISDGTTFRLQSTIATGNKQGMCTFDQCACEKYARGLMTREAALDQMTDPNTIQQLNSIWAQREAQSMKQQR